MRRQIWAVLTVTASLTLTTQPGLAGPAAQAVPPASGISCAPGAPLWFQAIIQRGPAAGESVAGTLVLTSAATLLQGTLQTADARWLASGLALRGVLRLEFLLPPQELMASGSMLEPCNYQGYLSGPGKGDSGTWTLQGSAASPTASATPPAPTGTNTPVATPTTTATVTATQPVPTATSTPPAPSATETPAPGRPASYLLTASIAAGPDQGQQLAGVYQCQAGIFGMPCHGSVRLWNGTVLAIAGGFQAGVWLFGGGTLAISGTGTIFGGSGTLRYAPGGDSGSWQSTYQRATP